jgi:hypothetical protein
VKRLGSCPCVPQLIGEGFDRRLGHAFRVWTDRIGTWWPPDHTATGQADLIVLEGGVGARIYERTSDGVEHDWAR